MPKKMYAVFSDKAYADLKNGKAIDNNGFRTAKGSFHPDQPRYQPLNMRSEALKDLLTSLGK